ncbi:MAG: four helix bundle protein [Alloalcanivorax venustensis]|jgi:four helix bundle protein|uniref:four helix bundle protein n=1 Tax=Alloalcanivorax venustensis TaxID=172371 RepID=UPI0030012DEE
MARRNIVREKSRTFALRVVAACRALQGDQREFVLSRQLLRSGTAVGAMVREAEHAESTADFRHKIAVALKEANESDYWLDLLIESGYLPRALGESLREDCGEILKILVAITKTTRNRRQ